MRRSGLILVLILPRLDAARDAFFSTTTTSTRSLAPVRSYDVTNEHWDAYFAPLSNPAAPIQVTAYNAKSGDVLSYPETDGWDRDFLLANAHRGRELIGFPMSFGDSRESSSFIKRSSHRFTEVLKEAYFSEVFCRGARHIRSFFGSAFDRGTKYRQDTIECIQACENTAGQNELGVNVSRAALVNSDFMQSCHVPLTHSLRGRFMNTVATESSAVTLQLPPWLFELSGVYNRNDLVEFLVQVNITRCPPRLLETGDLAVGSEDLTMPDMRENATMGSAWIATRPIENPLDEFDFTPISQRETPRFRIAPSMHYATYQLSSLGTPSIVGSPVLDAPVIVRMPSAQQFVVDIAPFIRRMWDTDHLEFSLLSSCAIAAVNDLFVFRRATNWLYQPESRTCPLAGQDCDACRSAGCSWCRARARGDDFLDLEWAELSQPRPTGRCGAPEEACIAHYGKVGDRNICQPVSKLEG